MPTPFIVPGWNPLDGPPANDDEVFELLSAAVFQARFRPDIIRARWPAIREAFAEFRLDVVATWSDDSVPRLMANERIVRNKKKLRAVLRNARDLHALALEHGGALSYLDQLGDEASEVRAIDTWAHYIGAPSIRWFVRARRGQGLTRV